MGHVLKIVPLVLALATVGRAAVNESIILGKSFLVKDGQPGGDPTLRKIVGLGKELASPDVLTGDPIANGATIEIIANGDHPTDQVFTLPPGAAPQGGTGWKALGSQPLGYQYKDVAGANGPVKVALIKKATNGTFLVKAVIMGALGPGPQPHITVLPPDPGTDGGMIFTIPGGDAYCVTFGGAAGGKLVNSGAKVFKVTATMDLPTTEAGCPVAGSTTTTSSTTSTSTVTFPTTTISFAANVQPILTAKCAVPSCHTGAFPTQGLDLTASAYAALGPGTAVSTECGPKLLVVPVSPSTSYLFQKLQGSGPGCFLGSQMPQIGGPLTAGEMTTISSWIAQGAQNN